MIDEIRCKWTRLPDDCHPLNLRRVMYRIGCSATTASGPHPIYPDACPDCGKLVVIAHQVSAGGK